MFYVMLHGQNDILGVELFDGTFYPDTGVYTSAGKPILVPEEALDMATARRLKRIRPATPQELIDGVVISSTEEGFFGVGTAREVEIYYLWRTDGARRPFKRPKSMVVYDHIW